MKRTVAFLLSASMLCGTSFISAHALVQPPVYLASNTSGMCGKTVRWEVKNQTLYITGQGAMDDLDIAVNHGQANYHDALSSFDKVVIEEGITRIGSRAFKDYDRIQSITLPESLTEIGAYAFYNTGLTTVKLPKNVSTIGAFAFSHCPKLTTFQLAPENKTFTADGAQLSLRDPALTLFGPDLDVPYSAGMCGTSAWYTCDGKTLQINGTGAVTQAPWTAYVTPWQANEIQKIEIGAGITEIGDEVFSKHYKCGQIHFAENSELQKIGRQSFAENHVLTELNLPETVKQIGSGAFLRCQALEKVNQPKALMACAEDAFWGTKFAGFSVSAAPDPNNTDWMFASNVTSFTLPAGNTDYIVKDGVLFSKDGKTLVRYPIGRTEHRYVVPTGTTKIAERAFEGAGELYWVDLPDGLTQIDAHAFYNCGKLSAIYLPDTIQTVGQGAFKQCTSMTLLKLSHNLEQLPTELCADCDSLTSVVIPEGVQSVAPHTFARCKNLKRISFPRSLKEITGSVFSASDLVDTAIFYDTNAVFAEDALFGIGGTNGEFATNGAPSPKLTVYAPEGSNAQTYAKAHKIQYSALPQAPSLDNVKRVSAYQSGQFSDVSESAWYGDKKTGAIRNACELGIMQGSGKGKFQPNASITRAEAIKMATVLSDRYWGGTGALGAGSQVWYHDFLNYALANRILSWNTFSSYNTPATRAEMAYLFANALPESALNSKNSVTVPDVSASTPYHTEIERLYRAGILTGDAGTHAFRPNDPITRAEAAAIIVREAILGERI